MFTRLIHRKAVRKMVNKVQKQIETRTLGWHSYFAIKNKFSIRISADYRLALPCTVQQTIMPYEKCSQSTKHCPTLQSEEKQQVYLKLVA
jgi:hypothetical protein